MITHKSENNQSYSKTNLEDDRISDQKEQFFSYLEKAGIREFWAKLGHSLFFKCWVKDGDLVFRRTKINYDLRLEGEPRSCTRSWSLETMTNGYEHLLNKSLTFAQTSKDENGNVVTDDKGKPILTGGAFFGCMDGRSYFPLKKYQKNSTQVVTEIDDLSHDKQLAKYQWFSEVSGLNPYLISSGGKSVHCHLLTKEPYAIEKIVYLRRLLCLALDGDPAVTRPHQPVRLPTFYRKEKDDYQAILQEGEIYSYEQNLEGFKKVFEELNYTFPEQINHDWWQHLQRILNSDKQNNARKTEAVTKEDKLNNLKLALEKGQEGFYAERKKKQKARIEKAKKYKANYKWQSNSDKEKFIEELLETIPAREKGSGTYEDYRSFFCGIKNEIGSEAAIALAYSHSPTGENWNQIINSSTGSFSLGSLIYYAKEWGNWKPSRQEYIDPQHGKVILSGEDAIARAKEQIVNLTQDEIDECFTDHTAKKPKKDLTPEQIVAWVKKKRKKYYQSQKRKNKPNIIENNRYCSAPFIYKNLPEDFWGILSLESAKGTGKSVIIGSLIDHYKSQGYEVISLVPRVALAEEQSKRWNIKFINDAENKYKCALYEEHINLCIDSLHYLTNRDLDKKVVLVIDELNSFIEHLLSSSTLKENRNKILREFERLITEIFKNKGLIISADADLKQNHIDYFQNIIGKLYNCEFPIFSYRNDFKYEGREVYLFEKKNTLINLIDELVSKNQRLIIPCDTKDESKGIEQTLIKKYPNKKIICINSDSITDDYYRKFVTKPNETIRTEKPDVLLYTSSMGMGVSIDDSKLDYNYFNYVICLATGTLAPDQIRQQVWRYRRSCPVLMYCSERSSRYRPEVSLNVNDCQKSILKLTSSSLSMTDYLRDILATAKNDLDALERIKELIDESGINNVHLQQLAQIIALRNYEFENYRECLVDELKFIENNNIHEIQKGDEINISPDGTIHVTKTITPIDPKLLQLLWVVLGSFYNFSLAKYLLMLSGKTDSKFSSEVREQKREIKIVHSQKLSVAEKIPIEKAKELSKQNNLNQEDRLKVEKAFLAHSYGNLSDDHEFCYLAVRDKRRSLNKMRFGYLLQNPEIAKFYERKQWKNFHESCDYGIPLITDVKQLMPKIKLLRTLRIHELLEGFYGTSEQYSDLNINLKTGSQTMVLEDEKIKDLRKKWLRYKKQIKQILGYTFTDKTDTLKFLKFILRSLPFEIHKQDLTNTTFISMSKLADTHKTPHSNMIASYWHDVNREIQLKFNRDYEETQKYNPYKNVVNGAECYRNRDKNSEPQGKPFLTQNENKIPQPSTFEGENGKSQPPYNINFLPTPEKVTTYPDLEDTVTFMDSEQVPELPEGFYDDSEPDFYGDVKGDRCKQETGSDRRSVSNNQESLPPVQETTNPHPLTDLIRIGQRFVIKSSQTIYKVLDITKHELGLMVEAIAPNDVMRSRFALNNLIHTLKIEILTE